MSHQNNNGGVIQSVTAQSRAGGRKCQLHTPIPAPEGRGHDNNVITANRPAKAMPGTVGPWEPYLGLWVLGQSACWVEGRALDLYPDSGCVASCCLSLIPLVYLPLLSSWMITRHHQVFGLLGNTHLENKIKASGFS